MPPLHQSNMQCNCWPMLRSPPSHVYTCHKAKRPKHGSSWQAPLDSESLACACVVIYDYYYGQTPPTQVFNEYETKTTQACNPSTKGCCNSGTTLTQLAYDTSTLYSCYQTWIGQNFSVQVGINHITIRNVLREGARKVTTPS